MLQLLPLLLLFAEAHAEEWAEPWAPLEVSEYRAAEGDDEAFARADFDDTRWSDTWPDSRKSGVFWVRFRIRAEAPPAWLETHLAVVDVCDGAEVYADGERIGVVGNVAEHGKRALFDMVSVPTTVWDDGEVVFVVRRVRHVDGRHGGGTPAHTGQAKEGAGVDS